MDSITPRSHLPVQTRRGQGCERGHLDGSGHRVQWTGSQSRAGEGLYWGEEVGTEGHAAAGMSGGGLRHAVAPAATKPRRSSAAICSFRAPVRLPLWWARRPAGTSVARRGRRKCFPGARVPLASYDNGPGGRP